MTVLAIDTSESHCSVALFLGDGGVFECMEDIGRGHAERLIPMVEELLVEAGLVYSDLSRIAVITGPGTFTGLRIGLSVARGLALSLDIPCVGLMSLPVIAAGVGPVGELVHVVTKGRGGQVFYQAYHTAADALPKPVADPVNADAGDVVESMQGCAGQVAGSGVPLLVKIPEAIYASGVVAVKPSVLARLAKDLEPASYPPEPTYLRQADAIKAKAVFKVQS